MDCLWAKVRHACVPGQDETQRLPRANARGSECGAIMGQSPWGVTQVPERQPIKAGRKNEQGLTLVELIVVLTIIALISAVAVPGLARMGAFSRDTLSRETRELFEMLSAARIYATTWNVRTAVVYNLDHYQSPEQNPLNDPLVGGDAALLTDSMNSAPVRFIDAACMMYALPNSGGAFSEEIIQLKLQDGTENPVSSDAYVPMFGNEGNWRRFDDSIALLLTDPDSVFSSDYRNVYHSTRPRFSYDDDASFSSGVRSLGMHPGIPVLLDYDALSKMYTDKAIEGIPLPPLEERVQLLGRFVAHVFTPDGRVDAAGNTSRERYTFLMGYRPSESIDVRLSDPEQRSFIFPGKWTPAALRSSTCG